MRIPLTAAQEQIEINTEETTRQIHGGVNSILVALSPDQILKILAVTDSFNLNRESILIPLTMADNSAIDLLSDGRLKIVCPTGQSLDTWLNELRDRLQKMDLSKLRAL